MGETSDHPMQIDMEKAARLAQSETGQAIFAALQTQHGDMLQNAITQVQSGNYSQAKDVITSLLNSPEGKALLRQIKEGQNG